MPSLHASASRDARGVVHLSILNLDPNRSAELSLDVGGVPARKVTGRTLTAASMTALNDCGASPNVKPAPFDAVQLQGERVLARLPSKSVTVLAIE